MRNIWIIASREFKRYFISPLAYAVWLMIFLILGAIFSSSLFFGLTSGQFSPDGNQMLRPLASIFLWTIPAITMRLLADEQRMGTMELLLTKPLREWELVVGKWLGSLFFTLVIIGVTWVFPVITNRMSEPGIDQGALVSGYIGIVLMVGAMLAIGVLASSLFSSPWVAFFAALLGLLGLWIISGVVSGSGAVSQVLGYLGLGSHYFDNLYRGILDLSDVLYFISMTVLALFLSSQVVESRRWR